MVRVIQAFNYAVRDFTLDAIGTRGHHIRNRRAFSAFIPAAFQLMRRHRATPEEIIS
jgi:hypothetical protein